MSMWDGIEAVQANQKLPYLSKGSYIVELVSALEGLGGLTKEPFFKVTMKVVEATGDGSTAPGTLCCWVTKKDKYNYYLRDIKNWAAAVLAVPSSEVTAALVQGICSEPEAVGTRFLVQVDVEAKKNGLGEVTKYRFFAAPTSEQAPF
jgi:hypothetical protein